MSNRVRVPPIPSDPIQALSVIAEALGGLADAISVLQSQTGLSLPADYRFEVGGDGGIVIRRISTGNTSPITGPL